MVCHEYHQPSFCKLLKRDVNILDGMVCYGGVVDFPMEDDSDVLI